MSARTIAWTQPITTATGNVLDAFADLFGVERHEPVRPSGTATFHLGGILRVVLPITVTGTDPAREDERGTTVTMHAEADPKAWRRAVSMAVEQAIVSQAGRAAVMERAFREKDPSVRCRARKVARLGRYHGERKRRKAMRRLLRAAGVTVQA